MKQSKSYSMRLIAALESILKELVRKSLSRKILLKIKNYG